jgi:hypothetical protein
MRADVKPAAKAAVLCKRRTMTEKIRDEFTGVSNWTSETATKPGERHVYSGTTSTTERRQWPNVKA